MAVKNISLIQLDDKKIMSSDSNTDDNIENFDYTRFITAITDSRTTGAAADAAAQPTASEPAASEPAVAAPTNEHIYFKKIMIAANKKFYWEKLKDITSIIDSEKDNITKFYKHATNAYNMITKGYLITKINKSIYNFVHNDENNLWETRLYEIIDYYKCICKYVMLKREIVLRQATYIRIIMANKMYTPEIHEDITNVIYYPDFVLDHCNALNHKHYINYIILKNKLRHLLHNNENLNRNNIEEILNNFVQGSKKIFNVFLKIQEDETINRKKYLEFYYNCLDSFELIFDGIKIVNSEIIHIVYHDFAIDNIDNMLYFNKYHNKLKDNIKEIDSIYTKLNTSGIDTKNPINIHPYLKKNIDIELIEYLSLLDNKSIIYSVLEKLNEVVIDLENNNNGILERLKKMIIYNNTLRLTKRYKFRIKFDNEGVSKEQDNEEQVNHILKHLLEKPSTNFEIESFYAAFNTAVDKWLQSITTEFKKYKNVDKTKDIDKIESIESIESINKDTDISNIKNIISTIYEIKEESVKKFGYSNNKENDEAIIFFIDIVTNLQYIKDISEAYKIANEIKNENNISDLCKYIFIAKLLPNMSLNDKWKQLRNEIIKENKENKNTKPSIENITYDKFDNSIESDTTFDFIFEGNEKKSKSILDVKTLDPTKLINHLKESLPSPPSSPPL